MISACVQKTSTIQKVASSSVASVLDSTSQSESLQRKADMANNAAQRAEAPRPNNTGMPDNLKAGIENLSGFSMDNVRVHYNSSKPATVQALAYTQGTDIHVAPGQEKHLPHEAWHVAQQMAGRVSPTTNVNGMPVNDNAALEHEADVMGAKAVQCKTEKNDNSLMQKNEFSGLSPIQMVRENEFKQDPEKFMRENIVLCNYQLGLKLRMKLDDVQAFSFCKYMDAGVFDKNFFVLMPIGDEGKYVLTPALEKYDLTKIGDEKLRGVIASKINNLRLETNSYIEANYVPYKNGKPVNVQGDVGHVNVKRERNEIGNSAWNPDFVFTGGMQGCALATTIESEGRGDEFTLWHFQSPGSNRKVSSEFRRKGKITDWFGDEEYGAPFVPLLDSCHGNHVATNFLWRNQDEWNVVGQNNIIYEDSSHNLVDMKTDSSYSRKLNLSPCSDKGKKEISKRIYSGLLVNFWANAAAQCQSVVLGENIRHFYNNTFSFVGYLIECIEKDSLDSLERIVNSVRTSLNIEYDSLSKTEQQCCKSIKDGLFEILKDEKFLNPLSEDFSLTSNVSPVTPSPTRSQPLQPQQ